MIKRAERIIIPQSTAYNRHITGKIYGAGISGPIGAKFTIGSLHHEIGISGVYEINKQDLPIGEIFIDPIDKGFIRVIYLYEEEVQL